MTARRPPFLAPLSTAVGFLTRVPIGDGGTNRDVAGALCWFPLVGAVIGATVGLIRVGAGTAVTPLAGAALAVAGGALLTGGLHEDGLGDTADGFGGGWTPQQRLTIMDDARQGTYGVLAIVSSVVIRVAALSALSGWAAVSGAAAVHLLARAWAVAVLSLAKPATSEGLARSAHPGPGRKPGLLAALACSVGLAVIVAGPGAVAVAATAGLPVAGVTTALAYRKIGGVTGDVLGAVEQLAEVAGLLAVAGLAAHATGPGPWLPW
jgi:adenosylcobinamide-GDP ribazoletransferase